MHIINRMSSYIVNIMSLLFSAFFIAHTWGTELENTVQIAEHIEQSKTLLPDPSLDLNWLKSQDVWYVPLLHQTYAKNFLQFWGIPEAKEMKYEESMCLSVSSFAQSDVLWRAYGDYCLPEEVYFNPIRRGVADLALIKGEYAATAYIVLTDNHSYFISVAKHTDGQTLFLVFSTQQVLPPRTVNEIKNKLYSLGFTKDAFVSLKYDKCDPYKKCLGSSL